MRLSSIIILSALLLFNKSVSAQKDKVKSIQWEKIGSLPGTNGHPLGFAGVVAGVSNDAFIVGGGANFPDSMPWLGGKKRYYDDLYVYRKNSEDSLVLTRSLKLPFPLGYAACVSTSQGIVIAGGENNNGIINKVLLLQWDDVTKEISTKYLPNLPFALTGAGAAAHKGILYVAGGDMGADASDHLLSLDLDSANAEWKELPAIPHPVSHMVFLYQAGTNSIYLAGGRKKNDNKPSTLYRDVYSYSLANGKWKKEHPLPHALSAGTGAVAGNEIILFGGDAGETFHKTEELIFAIANERDESTKRHLMMEKMKVQSTHPGFCGSELVYDIVANKWNSVGCIPFDVPVTTVAVPWNNEVVIAGGEIRAGVRTPQIITAKIIQ